MDKFKVTVYTDKTKKEVLGKGMCIGLDHVYAYIVPNGSKEIQRLAINVLDYEESIK